MPPKGPRSSIGGGPKNGKKTNKGSADAYDEIEEWKKGKQLLKPKSQLELNDAELKETIAKQLTTTNPQLPEGLVEYNYGIGDFIPLPPPGNLVIVYEAQGTAIHKDSDEAHQQMVEQGMDPAAFDVSSESSLDEPQSIDKLQEEQAEGEEIKEEPDEEAKDDDGEDEAKVEKPDDEGEEAEPETEMKIETAKAPPKGGRPRKLTNQFNFCERAALTYNNPTRSQETQTLPPPMANFSANVLQWVIYDGYLKDYAAQLLEKELERERKEKDKAPVSKFQGPKKTQGRAQLSEAVQGRVFECWKVLERMINLNTYNDIAKDYRYWDDPSDEFRDEEGTLLPLWKFTYEKTKKNTITDIKWNPYYYDLFAVCFGFFDFIKPTSEGAVCMFTIKNPSFPDYICVTDSGVLCVDTHRVYPYMVVIGLYDGSVQVFNVQATCKEPAYRSNNVTNKHKGIVWEVWGTNIPQSVKLVGVQKLSTEYDLDEVSDDANSYKPEIVLHYNITEDAVDTANKMVKEYTARRLTMVKWAPDLPDGELNFYSVSSDGNINNWVLMQNELAVTTIITLYLSQDTVPGPDGTQLRVKGCASCVKLHPKNPIIYLIGTEEGYIYKCSTAYSSMYLLTYYAHQMPVNRIDFNKYNTDIFISCSGDWRIKIWEDNRLEPLFVFDVGDRVGDVKWAPYSSTVFAAVTTEGKVYVFDININKYKPICIQAVVSKRRNKLTRLSFNPKLPIIIVGDDKGCVTTLKLSPNLRIPCKAPKKQQYLDQWTLQCMKLDKLLSLVREPVTLTLPEDTAGTEES